MPGARVIEELNLALTKEAVELLKLEIPQVVELLAEPGSLLAVADKIIDVSPGDREYIEAIPATLREGMRSAIVEAIEQGRGVHISYAPSYDFEVGLGDYGGSLLVSVRGPFEAPFPRDSFAANQKP